MLVSTCRYPVLILCCVIIATSEGASESKDGTVRVLYIGGPEAVNQAQAAQHYINSKSILPSGYYLQIVDGDSHRNESVGIGQYHTGLKEMYHAC